MACCTLPASQMNAPDVTASTAMDEFEEFLPVLIASRSIAVLSVIAANQSKGGAGARPVAAPLVSPPAGRGGNDVDGEGGVTFECTASLQYSCVAQCLLRDLQSAGVPLFYLADGKSDTSTESRDEAAVSVSIGSTVERSFALSKEAVRAWMDLSAPWCDRPQAWTLWESTSHSVPGRHASPVSLLMSLKYDTAALDRRALGGDLPLG